MDLLAEADRHARGRNRRYDFRAHGPRDRRAVVVMRDDWPHADAAHARTHVHFPPEPHHRGALSHEPAVARRRQRIPVGDAAHNACIEGSRRKLVAAIVDLEEQDSIAARHVGRLQELDIGHIFDHAARIAGREIDVLNPGIGGIGRIKLSSDPADQMLVGAGVAERLTAEGGLGLGDLEMRDSRVGLGRHAGDGSHADRKASEPTHHRSSSRAALPTERIANDSSSVTALIIKFYISILSIVL